MANLRLNEQVQSVIDGTKYPQFAENYLKQDNQKHECDAWLAPNGLEKLYHAAPKNSHKAEGSQKLFRVLIVEDDAIAARVMRHMLESQFADCATIEIYHVDTGFDACNVIYVDFDLIFLDMHLPDLTGFEIFQNFKARRKMSTTPVIACSSDISCKEACLEAGMSDFIEKPADLKTLQSTIQRWKNKK